MKNHAGSNFHLLRALKLSHLRLLAELRAFGRLGVAAERMGIAQPAASRMLAEIEEIIGHPVHEKEGRTLRLTAAGEALAYRAERIKLELLDAARDIDEAVSGTVGHVRIGSVTGPSLSHLLPVLRSLRETDPGISAEVVVTTSDQLCEQVLSGRLDFAIGRVPAALRPQLSLRTIGREPLGLIVRRGHPLLLRPNLQITDMLGFDWVMSEDETPLAQTVQRWFSNMGYPLPKRWISTSSFLFTLALLKDSDAVAPLAIPVVQSFTGDVSMPFVQVPFQMEIEVESYGLFHRSDASLPPAATRMAEMIMSRDSDLRPKLSER